MGGYQTPYVSRIDPSWAHVRTREPPLFMMPHQWQPPIVPPNPYYTSHCDRIQAGYRKWGADYPDWYARRPEATHPDWFTRRMQTIREGDLKELQWSWERTSKATQRGMHTVPNCRGESTERPWKRGNFVGTPHELDGQVVVPRWGQYHPTNYEAPSRLELLPPIHGDEKRV